MDGQWQLDPTNSYTTGKGDFVNSLLIIDPNHEFVLEGYTDAERVVVTGTFNGWDTEGYHMERTKEGWRLPLHLHDGKVLYKFIVDEKWISDPVNPLWEPSPFKGKNSVLWVE